MAAACCVPRFVAKCARYSCLYGGRAAVASPRLRRCWHRRQTPCPRITRGRNDAASSQFGHAERVRACTWPRSSRCASGAALQSRASSWSRSRTSRRRRKPGPSPSPSPRPSPSPSRKRSKNASEVRLSSLVPVSVASRTPSAPSTSPSACHAAWTTGRRCVPTLAPPQTRLGAPCCCPCAARLLQS